MEHDSSGQQETADRQPSHGHPGAENVINPETGEVTRPAQETGNAEVTLTATISDGSSQTVKEFTVTVLALNPDTDIDDYADQLTLNAGFVSSDISLPETVGEATVAWSSSDPAITVNGNTAAVTRADGANTEVTLTAVVSLEGTDRTVTKEFPLTVLAARTGCSYPTSAVIRQQGRTAA